MDCGSIRGIADEASDALSGIKMFPDTRSSDTWQADCGIAGFVNWELKPIGGALKSALDSSEKRSQGCWQHGM